MKHKCANCGKLMELSGGQKYKAKWGQKTFYHKECTRAGQAISIYSVKNLS